MGYKILVVDDSPTERRIVADSLRNQGYVVSTAIDGTDALHKVTQDRPDLIVLDVVMPNLNGFQVCRRLKRAEQTKDIKIIMLTGQTNKSNYAWGMRQGADVYLGKPFAEAELLTHINNLL